jgi:hypothetical protein
MSALDAVLTRLDKVSRSGQGYKARCPAHRDRQPSLSITVGHDGRVLLKCHAGCTTEAIVSSLDLKMADLFRADERRNGTLDSRLARLSNGAKREGRESEQAKETPAREIGRIRYEIRDPDGTLVAVHVRVDVSDGSKNVYWEGPSREPDLGGRELETLPLYGVVRLAALPDVASVVVAEGEKATEALWRAGINAVGTVTGAMTTPGIDSLRCLERFKVALWPDNDDAGRSHMANVAEQLFELGVHPRLVTWTEAPAKGDAADVASAEEIRALVTAARPFRLDQQQPEHGSGPTSLWPSGRTVRLSEVVPRPVKWIWPGRIPRGKVTVVDGDPGLGKSTMTLDVAARLTTGSPMPDGSRSDVDGPAAVVLLSAEDGLDDTIRPRLDAAGADASLVVALVGVSDGDPENPERLPTLDDIVAIETAVRDNRAVLVIIDPLMAYMPGRADSSRDQDVRSVLARLARLAEDTDAAIVVVRHLNKSQQANALYRGGGSIGIIGAARSGLLVARDPDDETGSLRIVAMTKSNLAELAPALAYRLMQHHNGSIRVEWEGKTDHTADGLLAQPVSAEEKTATDEAVDWLRVVLTYKKQPAKEVQQAARDDGISDKCLRSARARLGVKIEREGFGEGSRSMWSLPPEPAKETGERDNQEEEPTEESSTDAQPTPYMPDLPTEANRASMDVEGNYEPRQTGVVLPFPGTTTIGAATDERTKTPDDGGWGDV